MGNVFEYLSTKYYCKKSNCFHIPLLTNYFIDQYVAYDFSQQRCIHFEIAICPSTIEFKDAFYIIYDDARNRIKEVQYGIKWQRFPVINLLYVNNNSKAIKNIDLLPKEIIFNTSLYYETPYEFLINHV